MKMKKDVGEARKCFGPSSIDCRRAIALISSLTSYKQFTAFFKRVIRNVDFNFLIPVFIRRGGYWYFYRCFSVFLSVCLFNYIFHSFLFRYCLENWFEACIVAKAIYWETTYQVWALLGLINKWWQNYV